MYMCIVHARIPLIPRLLEKVYFTKNFNVLKNVNIIISMMINLLASKMQWSLSIVLFSSIDINTGISYQEFHHLKVAIPEVT